MADGRHLEKSKIGHICANVWPIGRKFGMETHIGLPIGPVDKILNFLKSKMADGRHFKQSKNGHISAKVQAIDTKFGMLMHIGPLNSSIC